MTETPKTKKVVILGGSYGGVSTAHYLLKHAIPKVPDFEAYQVIIVSTSSQTFCRPAAPRAMISDAFFDQSKLFVSIEKSFEPYPKGYFRFIQGTATELDHTKRTVVVNLADGKTEKIDFHALVIATGASTPSPLFGFNHDEKALRNSWATLRKALPAAKNIIIVGGGPAGVETAGELGEFLNGRAGWLSSKLANPRVNITLVTSDSKLLPVLRASIAQKAESYLAKVGVTILKNSRVKTVSPEGAGTVDPAAGATLTLEDGTSLEADLYITATGVIPNTKFVAAELLTSDGRVETNPSTLRVDKAGPRIYSVGDASSYARPAIHQIFDAIPVLCANIKRDLLDRGEDRLFAEDKRETQLVPIGKSVGVGAAMGWQLPSLLIWMIKGRDYWLWTTGTLWSGKQWDKEAE